MLYPQKLYDFYKVEVVNFFNPIPTNLSSLELGTIEHINKCRSNQDLLIWRDMDNFTYHFTLLEPKIKEVKKYPVFNGNLFYKCVLIELQKQCIYKFPDEDTMIYKPYLP